MKSVRKGGFAALVRYIVDRQHKNERVGTVFITHCQSDQQQVAVTEILHTQVQNVRATSDKTYHLIVSFRAGKQPVQVHPASDAQARSMRRRCVGGIQWRRLRHQLGPAKPFTGSQTGNPGGSHQELSFWQEERCRVEHDAGQQDAARPLNKSQYKRAEPVDATRVMKRSIPMRFSIAAVTADGSHCAAIYRRGASTP